MESLVFILIMVIVGAIIGGLTNSLAIKMLFRPYTAKYIGGVRIPFTPGLIPKRQSEIATQMGRTVVEHLITPEALKKKIDNDKFYEQVLQWVKTEVEKLSNSSLNIKDLITKFNIPLEQEQLENLSKSKIEEKFLTWMKDNHHKEIRHILPNEMIQKAETHLPVISKYLVNQLDAFISSPEGKEKIGTIAENYLGDRGFFGSMISSFLGGDGLADKIQPAISKYLQSDDAINLITTILQTEWNKILTRELNQFEPIIMKNNIIEEVTNYIISWISFDKLYQLKISHLYRNYEGSIQSIFLPKLVLLLRNYLIDKMGILMERMNLQEVVRTEVETFDLKRLEDMVLGISKKELKMITYLGAFLGGLIGLVQGVLVNILG